MNLKFNLRRIAKLGANLATCLFAGFISLSAAAATATYPQSFSTGWNLAGNGLTTPIDVKATFGAQAGITTIWKWDAAATKWAFYSPALDTAGTLASYAANKGYSVLTTINQGEGYWVNASAQVSLAQANGTGFSLASSNLVTGWNLAATADSIAPASFTTNVGNVTTLWAWDNANSAWYFYAPSLAANSTLAGYITSKNYKDFGSLTLDNGRGFWVNYAGAPAGGGTGGATAPTAPTGVTATASSTTQINLSWTAVTGATGYNVYRTTATGAVVGTASKITANPVTTASFNDTGRTTTTAYFYIVTAVNATGESVASAEVNATTQTAGSTALAAPTGVTASAISSSQINLSWTTVAGAQAYYVYRATTAGLPVASMTNVTSGSAMVGPSTVATSLNDSYTLAAGTIYYYKVVALNATGASAASTEVSATTSAAGGGTGGTTPTITSFSPASGATGATVTITGTNLGSFTPLPLVKFGTTTATVSLGNSTTIIVTVPASLATGNSTITIANSDGTGSVTVGAFDVTAASGTGGTTPVVGLMGGAIIGTPLSLSNAVSTFSSNAVAAGNLLQGVTTDGTNLYVVNSSNQASGASKVSKINIATGAEVVLAGGGAAQGSADGSGTAASFTNPSGITTDGSNLFVVDAGNNTIRIIDSAGNVTTLAGTAGVTGFANASGPSASFNFGVGSAAIPTYTGIVGITTDGTNLYVADRLNNAIRKIVISSGAVTTFATITSPTGVTTDGTSLFVVGGATNVKIISKVNIATGAASIIHDGLTVGCMFTQLSSLCAQSISGITTDGTSLYLTDYNGSAVRKVDISTGVMSAIAGNPSSSTYNSSTSLGYVEGSGSTAKFSGAAGITTDGVSLFVTDTGNRVIRKIQAGAVATAPTAPTGMAATAASATQINLSWSAVTGATGYNVYRATATGVVVGAASKITASPLTAGSFNDTGLTAATAYYYKVTAVNAAGESVASIEASATTQSASGGAAPTGMAAAAVSASQIDVSWTAVSGAQGYHVYAADSPNLPLASMWKATGTTPVTATSYSMKSIPAGMTVYFKVTTVFASGESAGSTEVSATTLAAPAAPTGVTATAASASQINLSWTAVTGATGYNVYRGTVNGGALSKITASPLTTANFNDSGLTAATTYYYKVTTVNANGESVVSTAASATTQSSPLVAPTATTGSKSGGAVMGPLTLSGMVTPVTLSPALTMPPLTVALTTDGTSLYAYSFSQATGSYGIYKIDKASGATSLLATTVGKITALTSDGTNIFVVSYGAVGGVAGATTGAIFQITPAGVVTLVATLPGYSAYIYGISVAGNNLYFAVAGSAYTAGEREIKKLDLTTKVISTLTFGRNSCTAYMVCDGVGTNTASGTGATFNWLGAMTTDGTYLYVLEAANDNPGVVRQISLADGSVKTLGGIGRLLWANYASWLMGTGITTDGAGNVYVVNQASSQIIKYDIATNAASVVATGSAAGVNCASNKASSQACTGFHGGVTSDGTNLYAIDGNKLVKIQQTGVTILPAAPSGLSATAVSDTQISLSWTAVNGAIGYNVYRSTAANVAISAANKIATTADVTTAYTDSALTAVTPYYYIVTAVNAGTVANPGGESVASSEVTATTQAVIPVGPIGTQMGGARQGAIPISANVVTTFAGSTYGAADGTGTVAQFSYPQDITTDGTNLYVVDTNGHTIRRIVIATGAVTTLAGSGASGAVNGARTAASFNYPQGITTDGTNLYVADTGSQKIRQIVIATGAVTTLAGSGATGSADGAATVASFNSPKGITTDGTNLYVADTGSQKIRQIVIETGAVTTLAGSGVRGFADGAGTAAKFADPSGITTDGTNLYVADTFNSRVRQIVINTKVVTSLAYLNRPRGISTDGTNLYVADSGNHVIHKIEILSGTLTTLAGSSGVFGMLDSTGTGAKFNQPSGIVTDGINLYVTDYLNNKIRKIGVAPYTPAPAPVPAAPNGVTAAAISSSQIALNWPAVTGALGYYVYRATAPDLPLASMTNLSLGSASMGPSTLATSLNDNNLSAGTTYYYKVVALNANGTSAASFEVSTASLTNGAVTTPVPATGLMGGAILGTPLNLTKVVSTLAGSGTAGAVDATTTAASFKAPAGITTDGTYLYVADNGNHKIRKIMITTGVATTVAGSGTAGAVDGTDAAASFNGPWGITTDGTNLYVADSVNHKIRKIDIYTGAVTTLAGSGLIGAADGASATASFNYPFGITTDGTNLYVSDSSNHKIRKVVIATGMVTTLAGSSMTGNVIDGMGAAASFNAPAGITTDGTNLYVVDFGVNKIRQIVIANGAVTTLAGSGSAGATDGTGTAASFKDPRGISTDGTNLYVADGSKVRQVVIATKVVTTLAGMGVVGAVDGTGTAAAFNQPMGITTNGTSLYVADTVNNKIRKIQ